MPDKYTLLNNLDIQVENPTFSIEKFADFHELAVQDRGCRLTAGLQVFIDLILEEQESVKKVDRCLIDKYISMLDQMIGKQLDTILHNPEFQQLESSWRSLKFLADSSDVRANTRIELLDVDKISLIDDFEQSGDITQSVLYDHIYKKEYDMPGGEPFTAMVGDFSFSSRGEDLQLLKSLAQVAAAGHCPFIAAANPDFFNKRHFGSLLDTEDLTDYMGSAAFIEWNAFRETEDARYIGLTLPNFLLRLPYGRDNMTRLFNYTEDSDCHSKYLWGNASFPFAANMLKSFHQYGWIVNIRGPESGGRVTNLPLHQYQAGQQIENKIPTEILIPETLELALSELGFIPLSFYKNSNHGFFFSANSIQKYTPATTNI